MRGRREDRLVEHIFPIAGEFLAGSDARRHRMMPPAGAADHNALANRGGRRLAERQCGEVDAGERLHQAETCLLVITEHVPGHRAAVAEGEPDLLRLGDEIADGQHRAIFADQDTVTGTLGAERFG